MTNERMHTIGTCGGCGEIARRLLARVGGTPHLRINRETGTATHAAVMVNGRLVHFGDDEGMVAVTAEEFEEACRYDFDVDRMGATEEEIEEIVDLLIKDLPL